MHTQAQRAFWLRTQIDLAEHMLAMMQELTALKARVAQIERNLAKPQDHISMRRVIGLLRTWAKFLATPKGQSLIALLSPAVAAFIKWLLGSS